MTAPFVNAFTKLFCVVLLTAASAMVALATHHEQDVNQIGLKFTKSAAELKAGGTLIFHNSDDVIHNIMTIDENDMTEDYGLQKPGEAIKAKFELPGEFQVRCSIHPKMKMSVTVSK